MSKAAAEALKAEFHEKRYIVSDPNGIVKRLLVVLCDVGLFVRVDVAIDVVKFVDVILTLRDERRCYCCRPFLLGAGASVCVSFLLESTALTG